MATATTELDQMMKRMEEAGRPGKAHARLNALEGKWKTTTRMWMKPGDKAEESSGTCAFSWILGGRFLKQELAGEFAGKSFQNLNIIGYDNIREEYAAVWMCDAATGIATSSGQYDPASNAIRGEARFSDPMTGAKDRRTRVEWKLPAGDASIYSEYAKDESGKEYQAFEIVYQRAR